MFSIFSCNYLLFLYLLSVMPVCILCPFLKGLFIYKVYFRASRMGVKGQRERERKRISSGLPTECGAHSPEIMI